MSIICENEGKIYILTKGADTSMENLIDWDTTKTKNIVKDHLYKFAVNGLRTLVMAKREMSRSEWDSFEASCNKLETSNDPDKETKLLDLYAEKEINLTYLGSSAIEDKL